MILVNVFTGTEATGHFKPFSNCRAFPGQWYFSRHDKASGRELF